MIIQCKSCSRKFIVKDSDIPQSGRAVKCGYCSSAWHQLPVSVEKKKYKKDKDIIVKDNKNNENFSDQNVKASDGKTYKFLGQQWAQILPSGKTGLFAKKKIAEELNKITGKKIVKKKKKKLAEVDPSEGNFNYEKKLPDIYKPKKGLGFFGFIFLMIIIALSIIGVLKTFEEDLIYNFPEIEYVFDFLDEQFIYISETFKNIIVIIEDLISSY